MTVTAVDSASVLFSEAAGLNATGQVVGQTDAQFAFLFTPSTPNGTAGSSVHLPLPQLPTGPGTGGATAINANGDVVGFAETVVASGATVTRAVFWAAGTGTFVDLGTLIPDPQVPGAFLGNSKALGINDSGVVVGSSDTTFGVSHAFLFDPATRAMTDLGSLVPATSSVPDPSVANGINNLSDVVGDATALDTSGAAVTRAFLFPAGSSSMQDLGTLLLDASGTMQGNSSAAAINDARTIVGSSDTGTFGQQVDTTPSIFSALGRPPVEIVPSIGKATGISPAGDIVGQLGASSPTAFQFNSASGTVDLTTKFAAPGTGTITQAFGINSTGQIAAILDLNTVGQAVLLTP
jgi:probable HAF family extracellular repeat protein